jgi:hypothetical protein
VPLARPIPPRATPAPKPKPTIPVAAPVTRPVVMESAPVHPTEKAAALDFNAEAAMVVPPTRRKAARKRQRRIGSVIAVSIVVLIGLGLAVWGGVWLFHLHKEENTAEDPSRVASQFNCRFVPPGKPWRRDDNVKMKLHVHVAMRSSEGNNCLALFFKDYKTRQPSKAEMVDEAVNKLRSYFRGVEWELKPEEVGAQLAGQPAHLLEFVGDDPENVSIGGECYALTSRGYAYWFFTWGSIDAKESLLPEWAELREKFGLLNDRKGWTAKGRESEKVTFADGKYQLTHVKGLWSKQPNAEDYDALANLVLQGDEPDPNRQKHVSKAATLQVLLLPKAPDLKSAVAAAREYLQKREEREYPKTKIQPMKDKNGTEVDRNTEIGKVRGHLSKLLVQNTEDRERFMVLAVVNRPEAVVMLLADCQWDRRDFWDQEVMPVIESFKVLKGR